MCGNLETLSRSEAEEAINNYASGAVPFVFLISFTGQENIVLSKDDAARFGFFLEMPGISNHSFSNPRTGSVQFRKHPVNPERYREAFVHVIDQILYGNSFLLNLTFPTPVETNYSLQEIFTGSQAPFKLYIEDRLVVFSPERFVKIRGRRITSNPMKGTIDAAIPGAHSKLTSDRKEDAEHNTIVDLIRNDLSMVAHNVRVKRFKYIEKLRTHQGELLQMSSEISGDLPVDFKEKLGELLFSLLPAGSICGAPKKKTVEIIRSIEGYERGFYTGIFGHFDGANLDSAVAIRYLEREEDGYVFKSGGGITFQSDWLKEYNEMINKVYVPIY